MKSFKYITLLLLTAIIGTAIYLAVQPNSFEVTRTRIIKAPASVIYNNVIDFKNWEDWSPWVEKDTNTVIAFSEQTKGANGSYSWADKDGTGTMKTTETLKNESISQEMQFADFPSSQIQWNFKPNEDGSTKVRWAISGKDLPFKFKAYATFTGGMEKQVGPDFERGLEKLDSIVVNSMNAFQVKIDGITQYGGGFFMYKTTSATATNISQIMGKQYAEIMGYMMQNNITANGMPFTIYNDMMAENGSINMSNAIPIKNKINVPKDSQIRCGYIPKTRVLKTTLKGNYHNLTTAWKEAMEHLAEYNLVQSDIKPFEIYTNDPGNFPNPADWITEIYIPIEE